MISLATTTVLADSWGWHHGDVGIGWMVLSMILFWGAIIAFGSWLLRGASASRAEAPHEILRRRLADGSISVEEYEHRRAALESSTHADSDETPRTGTDVSSSASPSTST